MYLSLLTKIKRDYVLILASGGLDSTACIRFYKKLKFEIDVLFIDYGQSANALEFKALKKIAEHYKIQIKKIQIKNSARFKEGIVQGRNAFLLFSALLNFDKQNGTIASGIHYGTDYYDCSKEFIKQMQEIFDGYSQGTVKIGVPFLSFNKAEIYNYCVNERVPIKLTYSCELGKEKPCGRCNTCKDLKVIYASQK